MLTLLISTTHPNTNNLWEVTGGWPTFTFFVKVGTARSAVCANVDFASGMLEELDRSAKELNISRQAVIKTLIRQALDQQYLARGSRRFGKRR